MNLPNKLTILRLIMIPVFIAVFFITSLPCNFIIAAVIFCLAAITDFLDGYIARKYNLVTNLGKFLDPIADKVLVASAFIIMLVPFGNTLAILPWYASIGVALILARELIVSGFRMVAASKGVVLAADKSGKIKTFTQDVAVVVLLVSKALSFLPIYYVGIALFWVSVALTIVSGIECLVKNSTVLKD